MNWFECGAFAISTMVIIRGVVKELFCRNKPEPEPEPVVFENEAERKASTGKFPVELMRSLFDLYMSVSRTDWEFPDKVRDSLTKVRADIKIYDEILKQQEMKESDRSPEEDILSGNTSTFMCPKCGNMVPFIGKEFCARCNNCGTFVHMPPNYHG